MRYGMSKGFALYASGEDYIKQAYLCALSLKAKGNKYPISIITDGEVDNKNNVFDKVIPIPWQTVKDTTRYHTNNRWKVYHATPYDETIVMDTDVLVTQDLESWWKFFSNYELYFPTHAYTYRDTRITSNYYRLAFEKNNLPNVYSGIHYFKKSDTAYQFFKWLELISNNWEFFYGNFCKEYYPRLPSMDLSIAIVIKILELDNIVTNKKVDFIKFVHMKNHAQDWQAVRTSWLKQVGIYLTKDLDLIIGNYLQTGIFHYVENDFVTDDIISAYEEIVI